MAYTLANIENPVAYENAIKRNIIANARKTWLANTPRALEILDAVEAGREYNKGTVIYKEGFMGSMASALDSYGKLTPKIKVGLVSPTNNGSEFKCPFIFLKYLLLQV
jgi:hypothetical protein